MSPLPLGFYVNNTVTSTKISTFQCPSDRQNQFQVSPSYAGGALKDLLFSKGNYGASWGNLYWGQDLLAPASPMVDPATGGLPTFMKSAFGFYSVGLNSFSDGGSNTIAAAEVLQGAQTDIRGMMWSTIPGGASFMSRMAPNSPIDYYRSGIMGDLLNSTEFCITEPV